MDRLSSAIEASITLKKRPVRSEGTNMRLSDKQIDTFHRDGLIVIDQVFTSAEIRKIRSHIESLVTLAGTFSQPTLHNDTQFVVHGPQIHRIVWAIGAEPGLRRFAHDPRLTEPAAQLLESSTITHLISQVHPKLPGDGVSFTWHQDSEHRKYGSPFWTDVNAKGSYVQSILVIDPITPQNGPVVFIPGSNREGCLFLERDEKRRSAFDDHSGQMVATAQPGTVMFFNPYVVHGSRPNDSTDSRYIFINGFAHPQANRFEYPGCGTGEVVAVFE